MKGLASRDKNLLFLLAEVFAVLLKAHPLDIGGRITDSLNKIMLRQPAREPAIFLCRRTFMNCGYKDIPAKNLGSLDFRVRLLSILIPSDDTQNIT